MPPGPRRNTPKAGTKPQAKPEDDIRTKRGNLRGPKTPERVAAARGLIHGQYKQALAAARGVLAKDKRDWEMHRVAGASLIALRYIDEGLTHLEEALRLAPDEPIVICGVANARRVRGEHDAAFALLERALRLDPTNPVAIQLKASMLRAAGDEGGAMATLEPLLESGEDLDPGVAVAYADACIATKNFEPAVEHVERAIATKNINPTYRESLHNRLAQIFDGLGRYEEAWEQLRKQHTATPTRPQITDPRPFLNFWTREKIAQLPRAERSGERAVLIVGMPRSGTTLTESIIAAHPRGSGVGESPLIGRFGARFSEGEHDSYAVERMATEYHASLDAVSNAETLVVADKMPGNVFLLYVAWAVLPGCKVIRCQRDPRDVLVSCMFQSFRNRHTYVRDPMACAAQIISADRVYKHWQKILDMPMMDFHYRDTIADTEGAARRLLEHAGLDFHEDCLKFNEKKRTVQTASMAQVRRPIYKSSLARWKRYEEHLGPAIERLRDEGLLDDEED